MKFILWICQSRQRLAVAASLCFVALLAPSGMLADYIRNTSSSPVGDMLIQTVWLAFCLPASYFTSVLVGDLIFPNRWRERVILGNAEAGDAAMADDDPMAAVRAIRQTRTYKLPFYMLVVVGVLGCATAIEAATDGFLTAYQERGYFRTLMRTDKDDVKIAVIEEQADKRRQSHVSVAVEQLSGVFADKNQPKPVRITAAKILGQLGRYLVQSIDSWNAKSSAHGHWELELLRQMHQKTAPALRRSFVQGDAQIRRTVAIALGKMRDAGAGPMLVEYLQTHSDSIDEVYLGAASAMGFLHDFDRMAGLLKVAEMVRGEPKAFRVVSWAVGQTSRKFQVYEHETGPPPKEFDALIALYGDLLKSGKTEQRCVAAHVFNDTGHAGIITHLMEAFDREGSDETCGRHEIDMDEPAPFVMGEKQPVRRAVLWAFRNVAQGNEDVANWASKRAADKKLSKSMRDNLTSLANTARPRGQ